MGNLTDAVRLVCDLGDGGYRVEAEAGRLYVTPEPGAATLREIARLKPVLLRLLTPEPIPAGCACRECWASDAPPDGGKGQRCEV